MQAQDRGIFIPLLVYRTGPYAPNGIPFANSFSDYFTLVNERDGGINGVKIIWEECETQYKTDLGVECYERLKGKHGGALLVNAFSTGITYQLIPKAPIDNVVVHSMGYGMTAAADGRWFPWIFNFPMTYWSQASAFIKYVGSQEGGLDRLKGKKVVHIFHNSPYGREANPTLERLARRFGFELTLLPVEHPGQQQTSTWLKVRRIDPDWIYISGWGVMNQVAIKEAAARDMKMDHVVGNWWTGTETDVVPAGAEAKGYNVREPRGRWPRSRPAVGGRAVDHRLRLDRADARGGAPDAGGGGRAGGQETRLHQARLLPGELTRPHRRQPESQDPAITARLRPGPQPARRDSSGFARC